MKRNTKLFVLLAVIVVLTAIVLSGCNRQIFDTTYKFNRAVISLPNGQTIEGPVNSWTDFKDGDQLQVKIDGVTYLTHASNVVLISD